METIAEKYPEGFFEIPLPEGPWKHEPDKLQYTDRISGLPCLIVRNPMGALCGYVGVGSRHPAYGKFYDDVDVRVHGGLTFSDFCQEGGKICHKVSPGEDDNVWWLGFDCAHGGDLLPSMLSLRKRHPELKALASGTFCRPDTYRNISYVKEQNQMLALQLKEMGELKESLSKKRR